MRQLDFVLKKEKKMEKMNNENNTENIRGTNSAENNYTINATHGVYQSFSSGHNVSHESLSSGNIDALQHTPQMYVDIMPHQQMFYPMNNGDIARGMMQRTQEMGVVALHTLFSVQIAKIEQLNQTLQVWARMCVPLTLPHERYDPIAHRFSQLLNSYNALLVEFTELLHITQNDGSESQNSQLQDRRDSDRFESDNTFIHNQLSHKSKEHVHSDHLHPITAPMIDINRQPLPNQVVPPISQPRPHKVKLDGPLQCEFCHTIQTPEWRSGPNGKKTLCNRCGIRFSKLKKKMGNAPVELSDLHKTQKSKSPTNKPRKQKESPPTTHIQEPQPQPMPLFTPNMPPRPNLDMNMYYYSPYTSLQNINPTIQPSTDYQVKQEYVIRV